MDTDPGNVAGQAAGMMHARLTVVRALPADFVTDVVNEWGTTPRQVAGEQDQDYPDIAVLAAAHKIDPGPAVTLMSEQDLAGVADALYPVFSATAADATIAVVNDVLASIAPQARLGRNGTLFAGQWAAPAAKQLLAGCTLALYEELIRWGDGRRLGLCGGARCADVYVDRSRSGRRRFCSLACQNRTRVAAFRAKRR